jgi:hypothetical protein
MYYWSWRGRQIAAGWISLAAGSLVVLFWILYFHGALGLGADDPVVTQYELAFPLPDAILAAALFGAGVRLLLNQSAGPFLLVVAASMSIYLGLLDFAFYAQRGLYTELDGTSIVELVVNVLCIGGGAFGLRIGWLLWSRR